MKKTKLKILVLGPATRLGLQSAFTTILHEKKSSSRRSLKRMFVTDKSDLAVATTFGRLLVCKFLNTDTEVEIEASRKRSRHTTKSFN